MKIEYGEDFGRLKFSCEKDDLKLSGTVPDSIVNKDRVAITKYVRERMDNHIRQTKKDKIKNKKRVEKISNTNVSITVNHNEQKLRGRIVDYRGKGDRGLITIILESPKKYEGDNSIYSCFGMGMAGIRVFDDDGNLTNWAVDRAKESLIKIYERKRKREIADKLNKG